MTQQFDTLGQAYDDSLNLPFRQDMEMPSLLEALGDLTDLSIIDIGCGAGTYSRLFKRAGARQVLGVDAAPGMIETAERMEHDHPLGIQYACVDIADPPDLGTFDLAVGVYVLPYAATFERLRTMCQGIAGTLTPGGRLVTLPLNPDFAPETGWYEAYGFTLSCAEPRAEGTPVTLTVDQPEGSFAVTAYRWTREAHEIALRDAGFTQFAWSNPRPTRKGIATHGAKFWGLYLARPHALILDCHKRPFTTST